MVKTTKLFKSPPGYVNALAVAPEGLWLGQQKLSGKAAESYHLPEPTDLREAAWLVDWNGKLLKTVQTNSRNTSGMAYGDGCVWMMANQEPEGVFQVDMNSRKSATARFRWACPARTAAAAMARNGTTASCGSWPTGRACCCASIPRPGRRKQRSRSMPRRTSRAGMT